MSALRTGLSLVLLSLALTAPAAADCSAGHTAVWPPDGIDVGPMPLLVLTLGGTHQARLTDNAVRLTADGKPVPLTALWRSAGHDQLQAAWRPAKPLREGARLRLSLPVDGQRKVLARWRVNEPGPTPRWKTPPVAGPVETHRYGCGPAVYAPVTTGLPDDGPAVIARVGHHTALLQPRAGVLHIGHGMCGGPFPPSALIHPLRLTLVDPTGVEGSTVELAPPPSSPWPAAAASSKVPP
ncbi:MAG: hypothetical protein H6702_22710 [Myxococcales bacterium]|nr:hypothetical protein [Myxococcales bacterium]